MKVLSRIYASLSLLSNTREGSYSMAVLPLIIASLFVLYVVFVRPLLRRKQYQEFSKKARANSALRSRYYLRSVFTLWTWFVVIGIILQIGSVPPSMLGLRMPDDWGTTLLFIGEVVVLLPIVSVVLVRRIEKTRRPGLARLLLELKELLPHTSRESRLWLLLSFSAGICEELLFRGFLPWYFLVLGPLLGLQVSVLAAFILSSILFGFAHVYQGWKGAVGTGLMGALLAYLYFSTGSLILPIVCHILIDARIVLFAPVLLRLDRLKGA